MNYDIIIPHAVRTNPNLSASAKLIFGEILLLQKKHGFCFAENKYFAELYNLKRDKTVSTWIKELEVECLVEVEIIADAGGRGKKRKIFITCEVDSPILKYREKAPDQGRKNALEKEQPRAEKRPTKGEKTPDQGRKNALPINSSINSNNISSITANAEHTQLFLSFFNFVDSYQNEVGDNSSTKKEILLNLFINNILGIKVKEIEGGVTSEQADKIKIGLMQLENMLSQHKADKISFESNGKEWYKKSLKQLLFSQAYTNIPKRVESAPNGSKTALNQALQPAPNDWKQILLKKLEEKQLKNGLSEQELVYLLAASRPAYGKFVPTNDDEGKILVVGKFIELASPRFDRTLKGQILENHFKQVFAEWAGSETGAAFGRFLSQRHQARLASI